MVCAFELPHTLNSDEVDWLLYHAQDRLISSAALAHRAEVIFAEKKTSATQANLLRGDLQSLA
jgi:cellobiose-specific phosphotransferase system component IIA